MQQLSLAGPSVVDLVGSVLSGHLFVGSLLRNMIHIMWDADSALQPCVHYCFLMDATPDGHAQLLLEV